MTEIIIDIEHGEKLKFRSPITSGKAYEILKLAKPCSRQPMGHSFSGGKAQVCVVQPPFYALP